MVITVAGEKKEVKDLTETASELWIEQGKM